MPEKSVTILIVDDSGFMQNLIKKILQKGGYNKFYYANSGNEALDIIENNDIDVAFLDINMLDGDGIYTMKQINEKYYKNNVNKPKCIVVSALDQMSVAEEVSKLGAFGYIQKPFDEEDILESLKKVLSGDS